MVYWMVLSAIEWMNGLMNNLMKGLMNFFSSIEWMNGVMNDLMNYLINGLLNVFIGYWLNE